MLKTILTLTIAAGALGAVAHAGERGGKFDRYDKDGDGKIAVSDLDARHKEFVAKADVDGDGFITKEEMDAHRDARRAEHEARRFPDANNNGTVDRREFEDAARARFDEMDANGDGLISKDEMPERRGFKRGAPDDKD